MVHLVSYELQWFHGCRRPAWSYHQIADAIKGISGTWCHIAESKWLVETELSTSQVAEIIAPFTVVGDKIFVTRIHRDWSAYGLTQEQITWLNARNYDTLLERLLNLLPLPKPATALAKAISPAFNPFSPPNPFRPRP